MRRGGAGFKKDIVFGVGCYLCQTSKPAICNMQNLSQILAIYQDYQSRHPFVYQPEELYQPIDYLLHLGGKGIRPQLVLLGCFMFQEDVTPALPAAYAVEIFHNFTLMHDDIMDAAPLRRGKPTVHETFGVNSAILSGDVMLIYAYDYLAKVDRAALLPNLLRSFNKTAIEVCEGQQLDINFEKRMDVSLSEYLKMIELKTAALLGGALELGALIGGASSAQAAMLAQFGRKMGIAFQIQDDLLDVYGDPQKFGKKPGGDILQKKKTFLFLQALEAADATDKRALIHLYDNPLPDEKQQIAAVIDFFERVGVKDKILERQRSLISEAEKHLQNLQAPANKMRLLLEWAHGIVNREV